MITLIKTEIKNIKRRSQNYPQAALLEAGGKSQVHFDGQ
jgi:hypothetical protein